MTHAGRLGVDARVHGGGGLVGPRRRAGLASEHGGCGDGGGEGAERRGGGHEGGRAEDGSHGVEGRVWRGEDAGESRCGRRRGAAGDAVLYTLATGHVERAAARGCVEEVSPAHPLGTRCQGLRRRHGAAQHLPGLCGLSVSERAHGCCREMLGRSGHRRACAERESGTICAGCHRATGAEHVRDREGVTHLRRRSGFSTSRRASRDSISVSPLFAVS
jgi:hypothetical protein